MVSAGHARNQPAPAGEYGNRATGEVVLNPDYLGAWTIAAAKKKQRRKRI